MLKLKNVSKFYYSKGIVSSGFTKVNLELNIGEFVAITGESGSGKSTLLNVLSGLDTYEEGEMFINGEDTGAYTEADFEQYRRKYIANIFQNFNLVNSYTVYQNVELAMCINGKTGKQVKQEILEVLKKVGLFKFKNTKASKLSGGQKQRVAIARALVRNTPIIVADEPTGNLDTKSAQAIMELLHDISKDKLVIIVTHNYEQAEPYVTRKITMHDGKITEDSVLKQTEQADDKSSAAVLGKMKIGSMFKLGLRNTFNVVPKFLLLLLIFTFTSFAVMSFYASFRKQAYDDSNQGYNNYFGNTEDERIVIKKSDLSAFTDEDFERLQSMPNTDYIVKDDVLLDRSVFLSSDMYYISGYVNPMESFRNQTLDYGVMPENDNEMVAVIGKEYYLSNEDTINEILNTDFLLNNDNTGEQMVSSSVRISGVKLEEGYNYMVKFYAAEGILKDIENSLHAEFSTIKMNVAGNEFTQENWSMQNKLIPNSWLPDNRVIVPEDWNGYFEDNECIGKTLHVSVENIYYSDSRDFIIFDTYNKDNFTSKTGYDDYDWNNGIILVNGENYYAFFNKGSFQISLFMKDAALTDSTMQELKDMGMEPFHVKDGLVNYGGSWVLVNNVMRTVWSVVLMVVLFFIDYFIIKLIMKSRNVYFSTLRMLGASKGNCGTLITIELAAVLNLAFALMVGLIYSSEKGYVNIPAIGEYIAYLNTPDYVLLYGILLVMSLAISFKYSRQLFKASAMSVYKEEL